MVGEKTQIENFQVFHQTTNFAQAVEQSATDHKIEASNPAKLGRGKELCQVKWWELNWVMGLNLSQAMIGAKFKRVQGQCQASDYSCVRRGVGAQLCQGVGDNLVKGFGAKLIRDKS